MECAGYGEVQSIALTLLRSDLNFFFLSPFNSHRKEQLVTGVRRLTISSNSLKASLSAMRRQRKNEAATVGALYQPKLILSSLKVTENVSFGIHKPSAHQNGLGGHVNVMDIKPTWNATSPCVLWVRQLQCRDLGEWLAVSPFCF